MNEDKTFPAASVLLKRQEVTYKPPTLLASEMTMREAFVMAAMQGVLTGGVKDSGGIPDGRPLAVAQWAVHYADATIAEMNMENPE